MGIAQWILFDKTNFDNYMMMVMEMVFFIIYCCLFDLHSEHGHKHNNKLLSLSELCYALKIQNEQQYSPNWHIRSSLYAARHLLDLSFFRKNNHWYYWSFIDKLCPYIFFFICIIKSYTYATIDYVNIVVFLGSGKR